MKYLNTFFMLSMVDISYNSYSMESEQIKVTTPKPFICELCKRLVYIPACICSTYPDQSAKTIFQEQLKLLKEKRNNKKASTQN